MAAAINGRAPADERRRGGSRAALELLAGELLPPLTGSWVPKLRPSSAAVATRREGHRAPGSSPTDRHPRWDRGYRLSLEIPLTLLARADEVIE